MLNRIRKITGYVLIFSSSVPAWFTAVRLLGQIGALVAVAAALMIVAGYIFINFDDFV